MEKAQTQVNRYRVLSGTHSEGYEPVIDPETGKQLLDPMTNKPLRGEPITYHAGQIVESKSDLLRFNSPGSIKFELLGARNSYFSEPVKQENEQDELGRMTVGQLREFAAANEVDLGPAKSKDDILRTIRESIMAPA